MNAILAWLIATLGPIIAAIIKALLERAIQKTGSQAEPSAANVRRVFEEARAEVGYLSFRKRALLRVCEQIVLKRIGALEVAAAGLVKDVPPLTDDEIASAVSSLNL